MASLAFASSPFAGSSEASRFGGVLVNTFAYVGSGLRMLPVDGRICRRDFDFARVTWVAWASLGYMALFPSVVCYLIYYYALSHIPASRVSAFSYLQPLLGYPDGDPAPGRTSDQVAALGRSARVRRGISGGARLMAGFVRLLRDNRNYRYTWIGQVVSEFGDHFNNIAVFSLALANTKSGMVVSGVMLSRAVPVLLAGPLAGVMLDRWTAGES